MRLTTCLCVVFLITGSAVPAVSAQINSSSICAAIPIDVGPVSGSLSDQDQKMVCDAAAKAQAFFVSHGIEIHRPISIRLHRDEIKNHANHIGLYHINRDRIDIVTLDHARHHCAEKPPFDIQMDEALYTSFIIHEIAHAIADQNISSTSPTLVVQEYLAYVTQFSMMDTSARTKILQKYRVAPFAGIEDMSLTYYQLDPNAFGVKAFLHYQTLENRSGFIQDLLSGAIKPGKAQMDWW